MPSKKLQYCTTTMTDITWLLNVLQQYCYYWEHFVSFCFFFRERGRGDGFDKPSKPLLLRLSLVKLEFQTELKTFETSDAVGQDIIERKKKKK